MLPLLALVATSDDLVAYHRRCGIPAAISARTMTELGQQAWVHRRTFGEFGLHTYDWLTVTWSGSLYWLGRLQFNLMRLDGEWVCSTSHPPDGRPGSGARWTTPFAGPLGSFRATSATVPVQDFWCDSWLLDPELAAALAPELEHQPISATLADLR